MEHIEEFKAPPKVTSLTQLVDELHRVFSCDRVNVDYVKRLMEGYVSNPEDWRKYAKRDKFKYTRNLVDSGNGRFDIMLLCWPESIASTIHDHTDAHCFMKVLQGELQEIRYKWPTDETPNNGMEELGRTRLPLNGVCYINDSLGLHRVENPSHSERAVSLHVYVPPFTTCQAFDQRTGRTQKCRVTFWSKYGKRITYQPSMDNSAPPDVHTIQYNCPLEKTCGERPRLTRQHEAIQE
ncbi:Cysteine dioxygenase type 1 [Amphibalanus amphitrite]|uniref:Cysteine dioxygenase n=1 Tax=Amphibalanus amphitrite TaxID=1232801 RepID=A0A6A4WJ71_AMPAM|nr:cysteine dioxygenase type 1-like [Amphibalanus amphitrite]XP_043246623.1 cysteine dioxygenase type 1-like [Amphibalanus amphitrite]KAF0295273.1 Cysteine dioxygenase type 1 [Amphibalanus amphitrite]KAF0302198.1 Cysteine dioxygenase type 1 [Amphibalanus amphitrite]